MTLKEAVFESSQNGHLQWENNLLQLHKSLRRIPSNEITRRLEMEAVQPKDIVFSMEQNVWYECSGGKYLIEVLNPYTLPEQLKKADMVLVSDMDDTLFRTTEWHEKEYECICEYWRQVGIGGGIEEAKKIYEMSKIIVPDLAEKESRYTPRLNFTLLKLFKEAQLKHSMGVVESMEQVKEQRDLIQGEIMVCGEVVLSKYEVDDELLGKVLNENHPSDYMYLPLIRDLFDSTNDAKNSILRVVMTRGKIEGPLGQVYKVHQSGVAMLSSVDMVIYTNDRKIEGLLYLANLFPELKSKDILLYDDNPSETAPFCELITRKGVNPFRMEVIEVRHSKSKRRDKKVMIHDLSGELVVREPYASAGYELRHGSNTPIESWEDVQDMEESQATIFDHYNIGDRVMGHVV
ncbi:MAG TPA: hypothetical protein VN174_02360 [Candidatus Methanoperedens sp.]|nr:hypothetical protein [Candidatus Methanoperedens sp.]